MCAPDCVLNLDEKHQHFNNEYDQIQFFCNLVYAVCTITPDALVSQIDSKEMGKTELYTNFANSIVNILSQRLVIQCHYNEILLNLANVFKKIVAGFIAI